MELLQIKILNTAVERLLNREMSELDMTYTQSTVIGYLLENREKDVCQRDIEYSLGLNHSTVSSILGRMEENGMVAITVSDEDHRYKKVALTERAVSRSEDISKKYRKVKKILFDGIAAEERETLNSAVQRMTANIAREEEN